MTSQLTLRSPSLRRSVLLVALLLSGCASYRPAPLPASANLATSVHGLNIARSKIALPALARYDFNPDKPLDATGLAILAVLNNPRLKAERLRLGVARAQAFDAGLLPDPQLGLTRDFPRNSGGATTSAYNLGLSYDIAALITHNAAHRAAQHAATQVNLQVLWAEWQTVAQARLLYTQLTGNTARLRILEQERALFSQRLQRSQAALAQGNVTRLDVDAQLVPLQALTQTIQSVERQQLGLQAQLHALLGLKADVALPLAAPTPPPVPDAAQVHATLQDLRHVRPDLLALQAGYQAQEQKVWQAVLGQFPTFNLGFTRGRDTSGVNTVGFGVSISLPLFNGNRGVIATQRATRAQLQADYQARLDQADADVRQAQADIALLQQQRRALQAALPALESADAAAQQALQQSAMSLLEFINQRTALLDQRLALQANAQQIAEQTLALQLVTGLGPYRHATASALQTTQHNAPL
ncbi:MAG: TolC family protein [Thiomonas sp.]